MQAKKTSKTKSLEKELRSKIIHSISITLNKEDKIIAEKLAKTIKKAASEVAKKFSKAKKKSDKKSLKADEKKKVVVKKKTPVKKKAVAKKAQSNGAASE